MQSRPCLSGLSQAQPETACHAARICPGMAASREQIITRRIPTQVHHCLLCLIVKEWSSGIAPPVIPSQVPLEFPVGYDRVAELYTPQKTSFRKASIRLTARNRCRLENVLVKLPSPRLEYSGMVPELGSQWLILSM